MNQESIVFEDDIISVSTEEDENVDIGGESILSKAGRFLFYGFLLLFPVWFLPTSIAQVDINKAYFGAVVLLASLMLSLGGMLQEGKIRFLSTRFYFLYFLFALAWLLSALFSASPFSSLWGFGVEPATFAGTLIAGIALFVTTIVFYDRTHIKRAFSLFLVSVGIVAVFFLIQSVFGKDIFGWPFAKERAFNPFGSWNATAALLGLGVVVSLPLFGIRSSWFTRFSAVLFFVSIIAVVCANVSQVWISIAIVSLVFVALSLSQREQRSRLFAISLFLLLAAVLFILLGDKLSPKLNQFGRPQELIPSAGTSMSIAQKVLSDSLIFGSGPNTFGFAWDRFRDPAVSNTIFWQARFTTGYSSFLTLVAETGIAGILTFLILVAAFLWQGVRALGRVGGEKSAYVRSAFAGALYLFLMWFLMPMSAPLMLLTFVFIGLFFVTCAETGMVRARVVGLFETKERGFVFSLLIIFLLVAGVGGIYFETTRYLGALAFGKGVQVFNIEGSVNGAEKVIVEQAITFDSSQDRYFRTVAQLEYIKIQRAFNNTSLDQKTRQEQFQDAYQKAIAAARSAVELGKSDANNYRVLAQIYELAIPIDPNVADLALENYDKARKLNSADPSLFVDIARTYLAVADVTLIRGGGSTSKQIASGKRDKAIEMLNEAVKLKSDYTEAHFTLSQLYVAQGKLDEAIQSAEQATRLVPNDVGVLFQLGLLYYRKENYDAAQAVLQRAIELNPNYSNAKYFLGLIYDRKNRPQDALKLFQDIAQLNPDNQEVQRIIAALQSGKKAMDVLTQPPPEQRKEAPLSDTKGKTQPGPQSPTQ
jgi:tetratricopeptide (TPR) repeat protein